MLMIETAARRSLRRKTWCDCERDDTVSVDEALIGSLACPAILLFTWIKTSPFSDSGCDETVSDEVDGVRDWGAVMILEATGVGRKSLVRALPSKFPSFMAFLAFLNANLRLGAAAERAIWNCSFRVLIN